MPTIAVMNFQPYFSDRIIECLEDEADRLLKKRGPPFESSPDPVIIRAGIDSYERRIEASDVRSDEILAVEEMIRSVSDFLNMRFIFDVRKEGGGVRRTIIAPPM